MSHSQPPHHDGESKASPSHAPETSDLPLSNNEEVAALPSPPPPPPPPPPSPSQSPPTPPKKILSTEEEHRSFLQGLKEYGKEISRNFLQSKTPGQVGSHAQKYYIRQSSEVKKRKTIHDDTLQTVQPSCPSNQDLSTPPHLNLSLSLNPPGIMPMQQDSTHHDRDQSHSVTRGWQHQDLSTPPHLNLSLNLNHPVIMPMQQDSTHHDRDQIHSVTRRWQQDSTHDNDNVNHSVPRSLQQVPARHDWDISHPSRHGNQHNRNIYPPPQYLYIDMIIQKSHQGHLDIFVKGSNHVRVQRVITMQDLPYHLDLSSQRIHIPYFCSGSLPPQQCRVIFKNFATQPYQ